MCYFKVTTNSFTSEISDCAIMLESKFGAIDTTNRTAKIPDNPTKGFVEFNTFSIN